MVRPRRGRLTGLGLSAACNWSTLPAARHRPEDEQFWPCQSQELYDALSGPKEIVRFTAAEGANWHCEPPALGLRDQRIFDWLDETLGS